VAVNSIYASIIPSYKYNLVLKSFSYGTQVMGHPVQPKNFHYTQVRTELVHDDIFPKARRLANINLRHIQDRQPTKLSVSSDIGTIMNRYCNIT
jgi:hypothetical protein